jgi:hypothetical protein
LQLNVGIIAASIPTTKPLLKKYGGASSYFPHNQYNGIDRSGQSAALKASRSRRSNLSPAITHTNGEDFEMVKSPNQSRKVSVYGVNTERTGSEEWILDDGSKDGHQIMRTTEVIVNNVEKGT